MSDDPKHSLFLSSDPLVLLLELLLQLPCGVLLLLKVLKLVLNLLDLEFRVGALLLALLLLRLELRKFLVKLGQCLALLVQVRLGGVELLLDGRHLLVELGKFLFSLVDRSIGKAETLVGLGEFGVHLVCGKEPCQTGSNRAEMNKSTNQSRPSRSESPSASP